MLIQDYLNSCKQKSFLIISLITFAVLAVAGSSCDPKQSVPPSQSMTAEHSTSELPGMEADLTLVFDSLQRGAFDHARQAMADVSDSPTKDQIISLLDQHETIEQIRSGKRQEALQKHLDEIAQIKEKVSAKQTPDVNDINETMLALIRAREFALEEQKDQLLDDSFVQDILAKMKANSDQNQQQGKWIDAYANCYYWLMGLYEDNQEYQDKGEELTQLSEIELSLKDSACGETAAERYEGIEPVMYLRALELLGSNYVKQIDYAEMLNDALKRCRLLGTVLSRTNAELPWKTSEENAAKWNEGLDLLVSQVQLQQQSTEPLEIKILAQTLDDVLKLNAQTLQLSEQVLIAHFAEASFGALDPFTTLVWPWNVKDFEKSMTQQFSGIGVEISKATGVLKVVSLLPDTPAYKSGLDADDEIIAVNGEPTEDMTIYCAVSKITGKRGSKVTLTIRRPSTGETKDVIIKRDKIVVQPLRGWTRESDGEWKYFIDSQNQIGYVRLTAFTETSGPDLDEVLRKLENEGLKGLILDLRFNSGGYLQSAAEVVDLFISEGVIVKSNPRQGFATYEIAHKSGTHPDYPMVILINGSSASASEIVAGALQDQTHQRATIIGGRSYGKGSVQVVTPFTGGGSQLKYTVAYYHLPSDQRVKNRYEAEDGEDDWGIAPDVEVKMLSNEMQEMLEIQRDNDVLTRTDHDTNGEPSKRHALTETLRADPQLSTALLVVQSKLIAQGHTLNPDTVLAAITMDDPNEDAHLIDGKE